MTAGPTFIWDASGLHHPGKAGRLDLLGSYVAGRNPLGRHLVTQIVADELALYGIDVPDWCELVALDALDDRQARTVIAGYGLTVHGSLWLLCRAVTAGNVDITSVSSFVEAARATGARLPFERFGFRAWAIGAGLLSTDDR